MKALSWLKYFVFLLLIVIVMWLQSILEVTFQTDFNNTHKINYFLYTIVILFPVFVGAVIGLEAFINEKARSGRWKLNLPKLIFIILPSLYVSMLYFITFLNNETINNILIKPLLKFFGGSSAFILVFQIILGYALMTLFYKANVNTEIAAEENSIYHEVYDNQDNTMGVYSYDPVNTDEDMSNEDEDFSGSNENAEKDEESEK